MSGWCGKCMYSMALCADSCWAQEKARQQIREQNTMDYPGKHGEIERLREIIRQNCNGDVVALALCEEAQAGPEKAPNELDIESCVAAWGLCHITGAQLAKLHRSLETTLSTLKALGEKGFVVIGIRNMIERIEGMQEEREKDRTNRGR